MFQILPSDKGIIAFAEDTENLGDLLLVAESFIYNLETQSKIRGPSERAQGRDSWCRVDRHRHCGNTGGECPSPCDDLDFLEEAVLYLFRTTRRS